MKPRSLPFVIALTLLAGWLPPTLARSPELPTITDVMGTGAIAPTGLPQTPSNASELIDQGFALLAQGRYMEAIAVFDQAIALNAHQPEAWLGRGYACYSQGNYPAALQSAQRAIALAPDYDAAWTLSGSVLFAMGRYADAPPPIS
ncbi:tetratricopeptide repeat protein [Nodosilinea sp. E11]|uniref:tetratricopeptide repeat protein n=1 Tax=Nodosilinea sp. E11 TaxID=3037479 RepID=UPI0029350BCA|nr:tetratricopeptide repeat protein [Nodosilinea sp. E11]WOD39767.1 tetratricopeptide repeat protein [Nodosilinea sp. E11]